MKDPQKDNGQRPAVFVLSVHEKEVLASDGNWQDVASDEEFLETGHKQRRPSRNIALHYAAKNKDAGFLTVEVPIQGSGPEPEGSLELPDSNSEKKKKVKKMGDAPTEPYCSRDTYFIAIWYKDEKFVRINRKSKLGEKYFLVSGHSTVAIDSYRNELYREINSIGHAFIITGLEHHAPKETMPDPPEDCNEGWANDWDYPLNVGLHEQLNDPDSSISKITDKMDKLIEKNMISEEEKEADLVES